MKRGGTAWGPAGAASASLHAALLVALVWRPHPRVAPPGDPATVQVEYVSQADARKGAPAVSAAPRVAQPAAALPSPPPDPLASLPAPPPSVPSPPAPPASRAAVNLGDSEDDRDALTVTGDAVVSSGPDARYRNMPPRYPREAILLHQQGSVRVLVHVTPAGEAGEVELVSSSGSPSLDDAAIEAVAKWHFKPATEGGVPVASVYPFELNFRDKPP